MELSFARCESIANTLPIGFYTGRRIEVQVDKEVKASFYDPMEDKIIVSYPVIAHRMKTMPKESTCTEEDRREASRRSHSGVLQQRLLLKYLLLLISQ